MHSILALCFGIISVGYLPSLPRYEVFLCFFVMLLLCIYWRRWLWCALLLGAVYGVGYGYWLVGQQLPVKWDNQTFTLRGEVVGLPRHDANSQRFHFRVQQATPLTYDTNPDSVDKNAAATNLAGKTVALSWYQRGHTYRAVAPGDHWQLTVKLRRPRGFVNPVGFDYQRYLLQQGISAGGYVKRDSANARLFHHCSRLRSDCWRYSLRERLLANSKKQPVNGLLLGLLIGDRGHITDSQWQALRETGTVHLLAISGLHIGLAALFGWWTGSLFQRAFNLLGLLHITHTLPSAMSIIFAIFYSLLAGLTLPTQRALVAVVIFQLALLLYRRVNPFLLVATGLFVVLLRDPLAAYTASFWLSFLAVVVLLFGFVGYSVGPPDTFIGRFVWRVQQLTKAQWVITVGLFLPGVLWLQGVSVLAPVANLIAVPYVSFITLPCLLLALLCLLTGFEFGHEVYAFAGKTLEMLFQFLMWLQQSALGFWHVGTSTFSPFVLIIAIIGIIGLLLPRGLTLRWLAFVCLLPVFFAEVSSYKLRISFFDVGQGTAVAVETPNRRLVYDVGRHYSSRFDTGADIVAPYLLQQGYHSVDRLFLSHGDSDHAGGAEGLASMLKIREYFSGEPNKTSGQQCLAGQNWNWDGVEFSVIWPRLGDLDDKSTSAKLNSNNRSCVLLIRYGERSILLSGDIESKIEKMLLEHYPKLSDIDILLASHHGSKTSSHQGWIDYLNPRYAVITAGYHSAYGHPHPDVVNRFRESGAEILHTGHAGAVRFTLAEGVALKSDWQLERWREKHRRYWFQP